MKKITMIIAAFVLVFSGLLGFTTLALAEQYSTIDAGDLGLEYGKQTGLGSTDVRTTVAQIIRVAMGLLGIVAVVIILVGGFKWMTAGGNEEQVGEAKKWIFSGVIGLAIILSAYALASFIINQLVVATTQTL
jgi:hypothetical protein